MSTANEMNLNCGWTDVLLSSKGKQDLVALKESVDYPLADAYVSSGMARAAETLWILYDREPDVVLEELREMNLGDFEMKSYDELKDNPEYQRWISDTYNKACPNGESRAVFNERVLSGFNKLCSIKADSAVVICHGGVIVSIMERLFPGQRSFYQWQPGNGHGYTLDITSGNAILVSEI
jgi:alpha-ribazole phosphatase